MAPLTAHGAAGFLKEGDKYLLGFVGSCFFFFFLLIPRQQFEVPIQANVGLKNFLFWCFYLSGSGVAGECATNIALLARCKKKEFLKKTTRNHVLFVSSAVNVSYN